MQERLQFGSSGPIGTIMVIYDYLQKLQFAKNIDSLVGPLRSNAQRFSHGLTAEIILIYCFCNTIRGMSRIEDWVNNNIYLHVLYPSIRSEYFNDDRIDDTLDALFRTGIDSIMFKQSVAMLKAFGIDTKEFFVDLTNFTVHGSFRKKASEEAITITFGHPKSGQRNKKIFALEAAASSDGGIACLFKSLSGNTADVTRYVPIWNSLKSLVGNTNFLMVGDCKLASTNNLLEISGSSGRYLAPEFETNRDRLRKDLELNTLTDLYEVDSGRKDSKPVKYRGFEVKSTLVDKDDKTKKYYQRRIIVHSSQLETDHINSINKNIEKLNDGLNDIYEKLKGKKYSEGKIKAKIDKFVRDNNIPKDIYNAFIINIEPKSETIEKKIGRGRKGINSKFETITNNWCVFSGFMCQEDAIRKIKSLCGYFVLVCNMPKSELSTKDVLKTYKKEYKVEKVFERLKSTLDPVPIHLGKVERIEALMFLLMTGGQVLSIIDRQVHMSLISSGEKLYGLYPNDRLTDRPTSEYMLDHVDSIEFNIYKTDNDHLNVGLTQFDDEDIKILKAMNINEDLFLDDTIEDALNRSYVKNDKVISELLYRRIFKAKRAKN